MNKTDALFLLINSLDKNEKVYFKRYSKKSTNNYLKLFDAIALQKEYNEDRLLKRFSKETFSKRLSVTKGHLYNNLLKSLQDYHYEISVKSTIEHILLCVEILFKKGLYEACAKLLTKAKNIAIKNEDESDSLLFEIIEWERKLLFTLIQDANKIQIALNNLKKEEEGAIKKYANIREYQSFVDQILLIQTKKETVIGKESLNLMKNLYHNPLLKSDKSALSFKAKLLRTNFFTIYYYLKKDPISAIKYIKQSVELMSGRSEMWNNRPAIYLLALNNLAIMYYEQKNYKEVFSVLDKIKPIPEKTTDIKIRKFILSGILEITTYNSIGDFIKASDFATSIIKGLKDYAEKINLWDRLDFYYQIAYSFFGSGDYKTSLKWANKLLNEKDTTKREDIINAAKLLDILLHFEKGNDDALESKIKSANRFFEPKITSAEKANSRYYFECLFIECLKEIIKDKNPKSAILIMRTFKERMQKNFKTALGNISKDNYELILNWLESKIEKRSFEEIVREKAKRLL